MTSCRAAPPVRQMVLIQCSSAAQQKCSRSVPDDESAIARPACPVMVICPGDVFRRALDVAVRSCPGNGAPREMSRPSGMIPISPAPAPPCALPESGPGSDLADGPSKGRAFRALGCRRAPARWWACPCSLLRGTGRNACRAPSIATRSPEFPGTFFRSARDKDCATPPWLAGRNIAVPSRSHRPIAALCARHCAARARSF